MPAHTTDLRFEGDVSLKLLALLCLLSSVGIAITTAGLLKDTPYVTLPVDRNSSKPSVPYQLFADFDDTQHDVVGVSIRVRRADNRTRIFAEQRSEFFELCNISMGDECEYASGVTSIVRHKTLTYGILQHPGMCIIGILVPAITVLMGFLLLAVFLHSKALFVSSSKTFIALSFAMGVSETGFVLHYAAALVFYAAFTFSHFCLSRAVRSWYRFNTAYRSLLAVYAFLVSVLCIASLTNVDCKHYVDFQIAVVCLSVPLQAFVSHIMVLVSPASILTVLPDTLKHAHIPENNFREVAEPCKSDETGKPFV
jgi:hypothetical protein